MSRYVAPIRVAKVKKNEDTMREQFDSRMWTDYCQMLGLPPLPATLCRLSRGSHAPRDKPPPLRVSL
ncbi:unnamed protein product, partial [Heterobilharzia americana]